MSKLFDTGILYFPDTVIFCSKDLNLEIHTQEEALTNKTLLDSQHPELYYKVNLAIQQANLVKVLSKDLYKALWKSNDEMITKYYDNNKVTLLEIEKELEE